MSRTYVRDRWRPYANGKWWQYTRGIDFTGDPESLRGSAQKWAKANGMVALTRKRPGVLFVKFVREVAR